MKTIGLIGGMSWESTQTYYQLINRCIQRQLGGLHSAQIILYSVDFAVIEKLQTENRWEESAAILAQTAQKLEAAGADFLVLCTNTMHKTAGTIQKAVRIPLLHIADATADALLAQNLHTVGLLGTKYTLTQDFYKKRLAEKGLEVLIPDSKDIETVNRIIYEELCRGIIREESRAAYAGIIDKLKTGGAQGVILGCTEIGLLIGAEHSSLSVFDTTHIHAEAAAAKALAPL